MSLWDVTLRVTISGVGVRTVVRTVEAPTLEQAIVTAKDDLAQIETILVKPTPT